MSSPRPRSTTPELVVRGGTVVDGSGAPARQADVRVVDGVITEIAEGLHGPVELDASGCLVAPGFVDLHTHYDPQVLWDPSISPSSSLGVTSVIAGNCGFSIAPCRPSERAALIGTFQNVEDVAASTLDAGIDWCFETYPDYLRHVHERGVAINFGTYLGHTPLRLWVMGADAWERHARPDEIERMALLVREALLAGSVGFSTDRSGYHRGDGGRVVPSAVAAGDEVRALMAACGAAGRGLVHCAPGEDFGWLYEVQPEIGRPITWSAILAYPPDARSKAPWAGKLAVHRRAVQAGADVHPQVTCRPLTMAFTLADPTVYAMVPSFGAVLGAPAERRAELYADPQWRDRACAELDSGRHVDARLATLKIDHSGDDALVGRRVSDLGHAGEHVFATMCRLALAENLETRFVVTFANDSPDDVGQLLVEPGCVLGLSDAGAHLNQLCDAAMPLDFLAEWVRDRELVSVETGIRRVTGELADLVGMPSRGYLRPGHFADLVVLDWARLGRGPTRRATDLPDGGDRLLTDRPTGVVHTLVNGVPIRLDERQCDLGGALPGAPVLAGAR